MHNHLPAAALKQVMEEASLVIARCGYSTVMDLAALRKKSILVPTPGQTEQSYLSEHLMKKGFALCASQDKFRLTNLLELSGEFNYQVPPASSGRSGFDEVLEEFVGKLRTVDR
jgi:UDP-N-acetylglucosamine:LPS N-acetylglucosamine transferase